jgi:hypothetical protein
MSGLMTRVLARQQADTFRVRGMYQKAREFYQKVLQGSEHLGPGIKSGIEKHIEHVEHEINRSTKAELSGEQIAPQPNVFQPEAPFPEHVVDGSTSAEALRNLLLTHPDQPDLIRMYANRLKADQRTEEAAKTYSSAAGLFFRDGRILQGWLCKLLEWRLQKAPRELLAATQEVIENSRPQGPVDEFVKSLSWSERVAVFSRFSLIWLPPGKTVTTPGNARDSLYFVISGFLEEGSLVRSKSSTPRTLREPDFFGFTESTADVRSVTRVELLRISREHLSSTFHRLAEVEKKIKRLCVTNGNKHPAGRQTRKGERYSIQTIMNISIADLQPDKPALVLKGFSHELSVTGVSFIPGQNGPSGEMENFGDASGLVGRKVNVKIMAEGISVEVQGLIVRTSRIVTNGQELPCFGIQFVELSPLARSMIFTFAGSANTYRL